MVKLCNLEVVLLFYPSLYIIKDFSSLTQATSDGHVCEKCGEDFESRYLQELYSAFIVLHHSFPWLKFLLFTLS